MRAPGNSHAELADRNIYATFQPLLYQVATAGLTGGDVAYPIRAVARKYQVAFRHGELTALASDITVWAAGVAAPQAVSTGACRRRPTGRTNTSGGLAIATSKSCPGSGPDPIAGEWAGRGPAGSPRCPGTRRRAHQRQPTGSCPPPRRCRPP